MDGLLRWAHRLARYGAWSGGALVILASVLIGIDIALRKLFSLSVGGASELSGYVLAIGSAWAMALALLDRAHIRIDSLYVVLPARLRAGLDILGLLVLAGFIGLLTWLGWKMFHQSFTLGSRALTPIATPLQYPQFLWLLGYVYFLLVIVLLLIRSIWALVVGDVLLVQQLAGSRTAVQELEEELQDVRRRLGDEAGQGSEPR